MLIQPSSTTTTAVPAETLSQSNPDADVPHDDSLRHIVKDVRDYQLRAMPLPGNPLNYFLLATTSSTRAGVLDTQKIADMIARGCCLADGDPQKAGWFSATQKILNGIPSEVQAQIFRKTFLNSEITLVSEWAALFALAHAATVPVETQIVLLEKIIERGGLIALQDKPFSQSVQRSKPSILNAVICCQHTLPELKQALIFHVGKIKEESDKRFADFIRLADVAWAATVDAYKAYESLEMIPSLDQIQEIGAQAQKFGREYLGYIQKTEECQQESLRALAVLDKLKGKPYRSLRRPIVNLNGSAEAIISEGAQLKEKNVVCRHLAYFWVNHVGMPGFDSSYLRSAENITWLLAGTFEEDIDFCLRKAPENYLVANAQFGDQLADWFADMISRGQTERRLLLVSDRHVMAAFLKIKEQATAGARQYVVLVFDPNETGSHVRKDAASPEGFCSPENVFAAYLSPSANHLHFSAVADPAIRCICLPENVGSINMPQLPDSMDRQLHCQHANSLTSQTVYDLFRANLFSKAPSRLMPTEVTRLHELVSWKVGDSFALEMAFQMGALESIECYLDLLSVAYQQQKNAGITDPSQGLMLRAGKLVDSLRFAIFWGGPVLVGTYQKLLDLFPESQRQDCWAEIRTSFPELLKIAIAQNTACAMEFAAQILRLLPENQRFAALGDIKSNVLFGVLEQHLEGIANYTQILNLLPENDLNRFSQEVGRGLNLPQETNLDSMDIAIHRLKMFVIEIVNLYPLHSQVGHESLGGSSEALI